MINFSTATTAAAIWMALLAAPAHAQDYRVLRYGNTSPWSFDMRDDKRDFTTNGFFPGNFATAPSNAWIGAAGLLESNPQRSAQPYPSQVVFGQSPHAAYCVQHYRSYDRSSGTYVGRDGLRHRC
jgi:BA14K-like protein